MMALMSTSLNVVSMAAVFCASLRRRAMVWRRRVMRTRSSRAASLGGEGARICVTGTGAVAIGARRRPLSAPRRRGGAAALAAAATASSLRICPRRPEPCTSASASPFSSMTLRAAGEGGMPPLPAGAASAAGAALGGCAGSGRLRGTQASRAGPQRRRLR